MLRVTLEREPDVLRISCSAFDPVVVQQMWDVPGAELVPGEYAWTVRLLPLNIAALDWVLEDRGRIPPATSAAAQVVLDTARTYWDRRRKLSRATHAEAELPEGWVVEPRPWQTVPLRYARESMPPERGGLYIADDTGLGKTGESMMVVADRDDWPCVVACPGPVVLQWCLQIRTLLPHRSVAFLPSVGTTRNPLGPDGVDMERSTRSMLPHDIYVVSYQNLGRWAGALVRRKVKALVCDEAHLLAHRTAMRTRIVQRLAKSVRDTIYLSGTPSPNGRTIELVPQLDTLGLLDDLGGRAFVDARFAGIQTLNGPNGKPQRGTPEELNDALRAVGYIRRTKRDVWPDLPPVDWQPVPVDVHHWDLELHEELRANMRQLRGPKLMAVAEELQRLTARAKLRPFESWLDCWLESTEAHEKIVVFADHRIVQKELAQCFECRLVTGGQSQDVRAEIIERFALSQQRVLVASLDVAKLGLNGLSMARYCAFVEVAWTPADMDQAAGRFHGRADDPHGVTAYLIQAPGTIDTFMYRRIGIKRHRLVSLVEGGNIQATVANDLRRAA